MSNFSNLAARWSKGVMLASLSTLAVTALAVPVMSPAAAQSSAFKPSNVANLSIGEGQVIKLDKAVADVWVSNPEVADVYVTNARQLNIYGKGRGESTIIATAPNGTVVYGASVRVSQNLTSVNEVLRAAMPDSSMTVTTVGQTAIINGVVASPEESAQAEAIVTGILNPGKKPGDQLDILPINRLRMAVPLQVNLKVRIAEVNRSALKSIGVNLTGIDSKPGGFLFGIGQGNPGTLGGGSSGGGRSFNVASVGTTLALGGKFLGLDLLGTLDLLTTDGLSTTLAEPNLTALSGETASFLAGGEFPIPISQGVGGAVAVEYKSYGVALAFSPVVLADGRISMRVRPEVSELSSEGALRLGGFDIPALTTRRAETTVELGSGQSFMLAGLLKAWNNNVISKAPFLGDLPILGTLFRSRNYRRAETELVIIVTPYLVRPVNGKLATPLDGYRSPNEGTAILEGQLYNGVSGPRPVAARPAPGVSAAAAGAAAPAPGFKL